jgi:HSP20 family protein
MALVRWDSSRELSSLQAEMNRLFQTFFDTPASGSGSGSGGNSGLRRWRPPMDLVETEDHFVLRADLPGVDENDVKVELEDSVLTISGERRHEQEVKQGGYYRIERASGNFARQLTLPDGVDADAVEASFDKGVLEVRIPKPAEHQPRRVAISVGDAPATIEAEAAEQAATS